MRAGKIRKSTQRFTDYANDLLSADMDTFDDRLNLLVNFCKTDPVMSNLHQQMLSHPRVDFDSWYQGVLDSRSSMAGSAHLSFPTDIDERMALMYQLICKINDKEIQLIQFSIECFASANNQINSHIYSFSQAILEPLFREIGYRLEDLDEELPDDNMEEVSPASFQIIHYAENVIQQNATGNNITQTGNIHVENDVAALLKSLKDEINNVISGEDKKEVLEVVSTVEGLAAEPQKNSRAISLLLKTLPSMGNIASIVSAILAAINLS